MEKLLNKSLTEYSDSEFLAFILADYFRNSKDEFVSDYVFTRLEKILQQLQKEEMN